MMKNHSLRILGPLLALALITPLASAKSTERPRLQVQVETPTVFDLIHQDDIADALVVHLNDAFRRSGFKGRIAQIDRPGEAIAGVPVLTVNLLDWRTRPTGFVECRVSATLTDANGHETHLGLFNGTAMQTGFRDRFTLSRTFEDAAVDAMRDLYRDFAKLEPAPADQLSK